MTIGANSEFAYQLEQIRAGTALRLIANMPPRNLKSILISVAWVAWRLGHDPRLNLVCVGYSNELSTKHARDCRAIMQSPLYRRLFPGNPTLHQHFQKRSRPHMTAPSKANRSLPFPKDGAQ